jgi:hypothetical protein
MLEEAAYDLEENHLSEEEETEGDRGRMSLPEETTKHLDTEDDDHD